MRKFTKVKGISEVRRLPRLGKIRLGMKIKRKDVAKCSCKDGCFRCTFPKETTYFVCPPEVQAVYGEKPTELDVMLPVNDPEVVFPQAYKFYGSSRGIKCMGDGETALRVNEETGEMEEVPCPTPDNCGYCKNKSGYPQCSFRASLMVMLPKVSVGGIYQIDTGSYNSAVDVNSGMDYCFGMLGRINMIPLKLRRVPRETFHDGKKRIHYTLMLTLDMDDVTMLEKFRRDKDMIVYQLPEPEDIRPDLDGQVVELREEDDIWGKMGPGPEEPEPDTNLITGQQLKKLRTRLTRAGIDHEEFQEWFYKLGGMESKPNLENIKKSWADRIDDKDGWEKALELFRQGEPEDAPITVQDREARAMKWGLAIEVAVALVSAMSRYIVCPEDGREVIGQHCIYECDPAAYMECAKWRK